MRWRRRRDRKPDLDEPISLYPHDGEDVLKRLLGVSDDESEIEEDEDS